jgi:hypothetical protein
MFIQFFNKENSKLIINKKIVQCSAKLKTFYQEMTLALANNS